MVDGYNMQKTILCYGDSNSWGLIPGKFNETYQLQTRLEKLEQDLQKVTGAIDIFSLVVSVTGEIGVNSFDHNLGRWPDMQGIFFACHPTKKEIVLADRGLGVLETLNKVRPDLTNHQDALKVAFTDYISGH